MAPKRFIVMAIDFGTTYSGYAYSFKDNPLKIFANHAWVAGSSRLLSIKTPSCVLLRPNKEFEAFGYEAENMYGELAERNEHHDWYLFRRFKMKLFDNTTLSVDTEIQDILEKSMRAITIFAHAIRYMRDHFLETIRKQTTDVKESDILYVLTVPAIWNDKAKQFMRTAASEAGIPDQQLKIALEPETASIWCQEIFESELSKVGTKYVIADLGGGTADFTSHEKMRDGTLKEIDKASGGPWGGTTVDDAYLNFISRFVGMKKIDALRRYHMEEFYDFLRDFEVKKRDFSGRKETCEAFRLPILLLYECGGIKKLQERISSSRSRHTVSLRRDRLQVDPSTVQNLFTDPATNIGNHLKKLFAKSELEDINYVVLVGGFSECTIIQEALKEAFPDKTFLIPPEAGLAVLKGAVKFGHMMDIISVRKSKFVYGIDCSRLFDKAVHSEDKKRFENGKEQCRDIFEKMVDINETLHHGMKRKTTLTPAYASQTAATINVYCTENTDAYYVTDPDCFHLGSLTVQLPQSRKLKKKGAHITLEFWDTELKCKVKILKTGEKYEETINCL